MTVTTGAEGGPEPAQCQCTACVERAQKTRVRVGRWITRHSDLTKPPTPLIRWALLLILGLSCWAAGIPLDFKDWLGPIIIAGALILPDVAGFAVGGFRLDLRQAQDDIATLRQEVNAQARASSVAGVAIGNDAIAAWTDALIRAARQANSDQASGAAAPWPSPGSGSSRAQQSTASPDGT